ncbi:P-loop containing nucleoside triphosphate hydrolase protein [Apodospora peruviana]|uniref:P-loop containing nucleoside triphosphate hydrolase protein n=1 Tax=Apodospora peruviana TaxID=516989 RepID=A0AAE0I633_9PEZI|nr:P-loop containing nucleoside triphosphate hydrolase protein [Apodospora peruviana]
MDDYHAIHGHDVSSFDVVDVDLPSTHRLPTVSAAKVLEDFEDGNERLNFVPTRLAALDAALSSRDGSTAVRGGIQKGQVTEIWGPPGAGKTSFGLQLAASCLREGSGVVWVDGCYRVPIERLRSVVGIVTNKHGEETALEELETFSHYDCPDLAHFIALLCRPTSLCVPKSTSLIVVDALSALVNHAFPKTVEPRTTPNPKGGNKGPSAAARRLQVLQYIINGLQKLAATRDVAIVVLTQCATKMQAERGATLIPAINAGVWEQGISTRLVLFRDWASEDGDGDGLRSLHLVGIQKLNGQTSSGLVADVCAFDIKSSGLVSVEYDNTQPTTALMSTPAPKRKLADTNFEIADSDDEDYGWQDDDEEVVPPMPSQWQGSEDILVKPTESDDDGEHLDPNDLDEIDDQGSVGREQQEAEEGTSESRSP